MISTGKPQTSGLDCRFCNLEILYMGKNKGEKIGILETLLCTHLNSVYHFQNTFPGQPSVWKGRGGVRPVLTFIFFFFSSPGKPSFALSVFFLTRCAAKSRHRQQNPSLPLKGNNRAGAPGGEKRWGKKKKKDEAQRQRDREKEGVSKFKVLSLEISSSTYKAPANLCYSARDPMGKCTVSFVLSKVLQVKMLLYI